jgi:hypothetical protein
MKTGLALLTVLAAAACGVTDPDPGGGGGAEGWRELTGSPLTPGTPPSACGPAPRR